MKTKLIDIGNSKGVRIPKVLREEAGLKKEVELRLKDGKLYIEPAREKIDPEALAAAKAWGPSYSAFAREWNTPEEDEAWADLQ